MLQLDSHKSVAMSINVVGSHLAEHAASPSRAEAMESRLAGVNGQWDAVCEQATLWQTRLQTALLEVKASYLCLDLSLTFTISEWRVPCNNPGAACMAGCDNSKSARGRAS